GGGARTGSTEQSRGWFSVRHIGRSHAVGVWRGRTVSARPRPVAVPSPTRQPIAPGGACPNTPPLGGVSRPWVREVPRAHTRGRGREGRGGRRKTRNGGRTRGLTPTLSQGQ